MAAMCANCLSNVDVLAGTIVAGAAAGRSTLREVLRRCGFATTTPAERDARVAQFLRDLDLDPVVVLAGAAQVPRRRWALSHIRTAPA